MEFGLCCLFYKPSRKASSFRAGMDRLGKKTALSFDDSEILSPIEAFEKSGFDKNKLWSIKL